MIHMVDAVKRAVQRRTRNRRRRQRERLDEAKRQTPVRWPAKRRTRVRNRTGPRETFAMAMNRLEKRRRIRFGSGFGHQGSSPTLSTGRARAERRRQRTHRRRMAAR